MLWYDNRTYLPCDLLVKMDIASMHCGLETRSPLLDHEVIEYCAALPVELKVKNRMGKYLLKKLAERYCPVEFVHRRKDGLWQTTGRMAARGVAADARRHSTQSERHVAS